MKEKVAVFGTLRFPPEKEINLIAQVKSMGSYPSAETV